MNNMRDSLQWDNLKKNINKLIKNKIENHQNEIYFL